jgi:hypothetical protein
MRIIAQYSLFVTQRIILKRIFNKLGGEAWTGLLWLRIETGGVFL